MTLLKMKAEIKHVLIYKGEQKQIQLSGRVFTALHDQGIEYESELFTQALRMLLEDGFVKEEEGIYRFSQRSLQ